MATIKVVTNIPKTLLELALAAGTPKVMLLDDTFTPNQDTFDFINDATGEVAGTGYTAGGVPLTMSVLLNTGTNTATLDADDIADGTFSVSCRWGAVYVDTGTPATSPVIAYIDFSGGGNTTLTGIAWNASGIVPFTVAA